MKRCSIVLTVFLIFFSFTCFGTAPAGYLVHEVGSGSTFEKLGIKQGDRVLSYDGKNVTSVNDSLELYNKLMNNSVKTVVIERDGKKQTLMYQIR